MEQILQSSSTVLIFLSFFFLSFLGFVFYVYNISQEKVVPISIFGSLIWISLRKWNNKNIIRFDQLLKSKPLNNKTVFLTGGSSGLGKEISIQLAEMGAQVFVTHLKGQAKFLYQHKNIVPLELDLRDWDSISECVQTLSEKTDHLDILVSNAGVVRPKLYVTKQNFEETFAVNFIGPVVLIFKLQEKGLLPKISSTNAGRSISNIQENQLPRIIFVSSDMHRRGGSISFADLGKIEEFNISKALYHYCYTKLLLTTFAMELSRRTKNSILVTILCPGAFYSNLTVFETPFFLSNIVQWIRWFSSPAYEAAKAVSYLAVREDLQTGSYFYQSFPSYVAETAQSEEIGKQLWKKLPQLIGSAVNWDSIA